MLCIIDEFTREAIAIRVARKLKSIEIIEGLSDLFVEPGIPPQRTPRPSSNNGATTTQYRENPFIAGISTASAADF